MVSVRVILSRARFLMLLLCVLVALVQIPLLSYIRRLSRVIVQLQRVSLRVLRRHCVLRVIWRSALKSLILSLLLPALFLARRRVCRLLLLLVRLRLRSLAPLEACLLRSLLLVSPVCSRSRRFTLFCWLIRRHARQALCRLLFWRALASAMVLLILLRMVATGGHLMVLLLLLLFVLLLVPRFVRSVSLVILLPLDLLWALRLISLFLFTVMRHVVIIRFWQSISLHTCLLRLRARRWYRHRRRRCRKRTENREPIKNSPGPHCQQAPRHIP